MPTEPYFDNPGQTAPATGPARQAPSEEAQKLAAQLAEIDAQIAFIQSSGMADYIKRAQIEALNEGRKKIARRIARQQQQLSEREQVEQQGAATDALDPFAERTPEQQAQYDAAIGIVDPNDLHRYGSTASRVVGDNELISAQSIDPSLFDSSWQDAESAFGDVAYSKDALRGMGEGSEYFGDLMRGGGRDAVSEAEYSRRVADAEQRRSAQTEAALAAEEARGGSSAGSRVLAEQAASSGQIADTYRAGMDANAMAQQRRDAAAGRYFDTQKGIGDTRFGADFDVAGGLDAFKASKNTALDNVAAQNAAATQQANIYGADSRTNADMYNAGRYTDAADMNTQRDWYTDDANVDVWNQTTAGNAATRGAGTGTWLGAMGMEGGQVLGQGGLDLSREQFQFQKSQAPSTFERVVAGAVPFVGAGANIFGSVYKPPARRDD